MRHPASRSAAQGFACRSFRAKGPMGEARAEARILADPRPKLALAMLTLLSLMAVLALV